MPRIKRAAQFAPFDALTGYKEALLESARETEPRRELEEDEKAVLDAKFRYLLSGESGPVSLRITYFAPDGRKEGGAYLEKEGILKRIDRNRRVLVFEDGTGIPLDDITGVDSDVFSEEE